MGAAFKRGRWTLAGIILLAAHVLSAQTPPAPAPQRRTQLVLLGTGNPNADPDRAGPSTAVVVDGVPYLVDFGPGVVRRAAAAFKNGVKALDVRNLRTASPSTQHPLTFRLTKSSPSL
jgi:hypothetical protein